MMAPAGAEVLRKDRRVILKRRWSVLLTLVSLRFSTPIASAQCWASPEAAARIGDELRSIRGDHDSLFEVPEPPVPHQRLLYAHDHSRHDRSRFIGHEPWRIPAEAEAVSEAAEDALPGKAEILLCLLAGAGDVAGRCPRPHRSDARLYDSDGGLESFHLLGNRLADRPGAGKVEAVSIEHA